MPDCRKDQESFKRWGATSQGERKGETTHAGLLRDTVVTSCALWGIYATVFRRKQLI